MFLALNPLNATGVRKFGKIHTLSRYSSETVGRSVIVTINDDRKSLSLIQNLRLDLKPEVELRRKLGFETRSRITPETRMHSDNLAKNGTKCCLIIYEV